MVVPYLKFIGLGLGIIKLLSSAKITDLEYGIEERVNKKITLKAFKLPKYFAINITTAKSSQPILAFKFFQSEKKKLQCKRNVNFSQYFSSVHAPVLIAE